MVDSAGEWKSGRMKPLTMTSSVNALGLTRRLMDVLSASFSGASTEEDWRLDMVYVSSRRQVFGYESGDGGMVPD